MGQSYIPKSTTVHDFLYQTFSSGATTLAVTNPIWVVKTRMCLQPTGANAANNPLQYNGVIGRLNLLLIS